MKHSKVSLFKGNMELTCPVIQKLMFKCTLPYFGKFNINLNRLFFYGFGYLSIFAGLWAIGYGTLQSYRWAKTFIKSLFNAKKYLNSDSPISKYEFGATNNTQPASPSEPKRAYAVIYGVANRAGVTYAHFLASKGFNLILIERDHQPLNDLENDLKAKFSQSKLRPPAIHKIVLNVFD
jgi:hypothetical protein